jgi:DNA-binding IclR family transcriptional regulator
MDSHLKTPSDPAAPSQKLSTVAQTIALLRFLADTPTAIGVNAISRELKIAPSSCFKILKQLLETDFVQFDDKTKGYSLGSAAILLARRALDPGNTFSLVLPSLTQFAMVNEVSVGFWRRIDRNRLVLAGFVESSNPMRIHMSVGQRLPLFIGAVGRAFAAELELTDSEIAHEVTNLRWQSPPDVASYLRQVRDYRKDGYAVDANNFSLGVTTIASVLRDAVGGACFGLSAICISGQIGREQVHTIGKNLVTLRASLETNWLGRR